MSPSLPSLFIFVSLSLLSLSYPHARACQKVQLQNHERFAACGPKRIGTIKVAARTDGVGATVDMDMARHRTCALIRVTTLPPEPGKSCTAVVVTQISGLPTTTELIVLAHQKEASHLIKTFPLLYLSAFLSQHFTQPPQLYLGASPNTSDTICPTGTGATVVIHIHIAGGSTVSSSVHPTVQIPSYVIYIAEFSFRTLYINF